MGDVLTASPSPLIMLLAESGKSKCFWGHSPQKNNDYCAAGRLVTVKTE